MLSGHGTFEENGKIYSNVVGMVEKTNKFFFPFLYCFKQDRLIIVNPIRSKYLGEIGDIVIGRVSEVTTYCQAPELIENRFQIGDGWLI